MIDVILSGLIGGLLGPTMVRWLRRYRYWAIFLVAMLMAHVALFVAGAFEKGINSAIRSTIDNTFTPVGILVPAGIGALAVIVAFVGSVLSPKNGGS
ncbi:hypothetical protein [Ralstonia syzygii]|uniref:Putative permease n=1 Tax=Ralstonia syzygii R24 TaxID=907261 RepID=G3A2C3_9RALS|nr:hypothetical protein [Ralstonia syzygii]CCA85559.1 putative permease [Ralstonia syzygii R24]